MSFDALPVGVHVAVEADGPEEAALLEGGGVHVDVGLGDPVRQHVGRGRQDVHEAGALARRVGQRVRVGHPLAAGGVEHGAQEQARVGLELGLGGPDRLEVEHVEELPLEDHLEDLRGRRGRVGVGDAHVADGRHPLGSETPHLPDQHGAPVVADEGRLLVAVVVEQARQVAGQLVGAVVGDLARTRAGAVAAQVGGHGPVAGVSQRAELVAPGVPELGEAVAEHHGGAVGRAGDRARAGGSRSPGSARA